MAEMSLGVPAVMLPHWSLPPVCTRTPCRRYRCTKSAPCLQAWRRINNEQETLAWITARFNKRWQSPSQGSSLAELGF